MLKRAADLVLALTLLVVLAPVIVVVAVVVAIDAGMPIVFWQQRPGLSGRPFRVYKFRTMGPSHAANGRKLTDEQRLSPSAGFCAAPGWMSCRSSSISSLVRCRSWDHGPCCRWISPPRTGRG